MCLQLWLGDFNALTREDYTQKQWNAIAAERSKSYWEEPRTEVSQRKQEPFLTFASVQADGPAEGRRAGRQLGKCGQTGQGFNLQVPISTL